MPTRRRYAYFRVRRGWSSSGYTLALSSDGARQAVIRLWDQGKGVCGSFSSEAELKEQMGRYYRHVPELRDKGWLDGLDIHDWEEDQSDVDPTAAERQRRRRAAVSRDSHALVTRDSHGDVTPPTETETETEVKTSPNGLAKRDEDIIQRVYRAWLDAWHYTEQQRRLTAKRRSAIRTRIGEYPAEHLDAAVRGSAFDPWPDRGMHNDLPQLLKPGNIERFRDWFYEGHGPKRVSETDRRVAGLLTGTR